MSEENKVHTYIAREDLQAVVRAFKRFPRTGLYEADPDRVFRSHQEFVAALAHHAYFSADVDQHRWEAAAVALSLPLAFSDIPDSAIASLRADQVLQMETAAIHGANTPDRTLKAAFQHAWQRHLDALSAGDFTALEALDALLDQIRIRVGDLSFVVWLCTALVATLEQRNLAAELERWLRRLSVPDALGNFRFAPEKISLAEYAAGRLRVLQARTEPLALAFEGITGEMIDISQMRGQVVLVQFWASWCRPCRREIPSVRAAYRAFRNEGLSVIGVSLDEIEPGEEIETTRSRVARFMAEHGMDWPTQCDGSRWKNPLARHFGINTIPSSILLDKAGRVVATNLRGAAISKRVGEVLGGANGVHDFGTTDER